MRDPLIIIIGAGPAGVSASIHLARSDIPHLLLDRTGLGGLVGAAHGIENVLGTPIGTSGEEFVRIMTATAHGLRVNFRKETADEISRQDGRYVVHCAGQSYRAEALILATGSSPRPPDWPEWQTAEQSGHVHYDCRTLPKDLKDARILVSGGGEIALDTALSVRLRGGHVRVLCRSRIRANARLRAEIVNSGTQIHEQARILGLAVAETGLCAQILVAAQTGHMIADHIVVCHGRTPERALLESFDSPIAIPGLWTCGDMNATGHSIAAAMGQGMSAAMQAERFLLSLKGNHNEPT